jgi:tyrosine-specific transport protein
MRSETSTARDFKEDSQILNNTLAGENPSSIPQKGAAAAAGSLFGAIALITGSTVGAGMLALPEVTAPAGFGPTAVGLVATWALLVAEALLMAEVNLELMRQAKPEDAGKIVTLRKMAEQTLGKPGKVVTLIYLLLSYCLLVAYLAKASEVLDYFAGHTLAPITSASLLCASIGGLFLFGGPNAADRLNQALTSVLFAFFIGILGVGISQNDVVGNLASNPASWSQLSPAVPILFLSLVYHDLVPLICSYLGGDRKLVRSALVLGSLVPLFMFLSWEAVALSLVPGGGLVLGGTVTGTDFASAAVAVQEVALTTGAAVVSTATTAVGAAAATIKPLTVDPLQVFVHRSGPGVGLAVECFSFLAVITSFMGTVYGLSETLRSEVPLMIQNLGTFIGSDAIASYDTSGSTKNKKTTNTANAVEVDDNDGTLQQQQGFLSDPSRVLALALTLGPPLAFTAENPGAFLAVLSIAGGYGMTALYGVMPPVMAWKLREQHLLMSEPVDENINQGTLQSSSSSNSSIKNSNNIKVYNNKNTSSAPTTPSSTSQYTAMMPGGLPALAGVFAAAVGVGLSRVAADADAAVEVVSRLVSAEEAEVFVSSVEMAATVLVTVASSIFTTAPFSS